MGLGLSPLSSRKNCREMLSGGVELYALIKGIKLFLKLYAIHCDVILLLFLLGGGLEGYADQPSACIRNIVLTIT